MQIELAYKPFGKVLHSVHLSTTPIVVFDHLNQQWAQAESGLARDSRGIEHFRAQDTECSGTLCNTLLHHHIASLCIDWFLNDNN